MVNDINHGVMRGLAARAQITESAQSARSDAAVQAAPLPVPERPEIKVDAEEMARNLRQAIEQINTVLKDGGRGLNFVMDQTVSGPIIQVKRAETGEVIRQIPNEVVVRVAHNLEKLQGILFSAAA